MEIKGIVEAKSEKFNGGLKINNSWYNGTKDNENIVKSINKGDFVKLTLDEKGKIKTVEKEVNFTNEEKKEKKIESEDKIEEDVLNIFRNREAIMLKCKEITDRIFGNDEKYKESMGQHCNSLYISIERELKNKGLI